MFSNLKVKTQNTEKKLCNFIKFMLLLLTNLVASKK